MYAHLWVEEITLFFAPSVTGQKIRNTYRKQNQLLEPRGTENYQES